MQQETGAIHYSDTNYDAMYGSGDYTYNGNGDYNYNGNATAFSGNQTIEPEFEQTANSTGLNVTSTAADEHIYYYYDDDYYDNTTGYYDHGASAAFYDRDNYFYEIYPFEIYALGYVWSVLVILMTIANVFVIGYFLSRKSRGKSTSLLFVSIAISDTMTGVSLLPNAIYVYAGDNEMLSRDWCTAAMMLRFYASRVFHTVSVWQTLLLCVQRYMCVCHPFTSGRICTFKKTVICIVVMYACACILHVYHLYDNKIGYFRCRWQTEKPCEGSCVYMWVCVAVLHLLPCVAIVTLTARTLVGLRNAHARVASCTMPKGRRRRFTRDRIITITATLVAIVFMISELPHGICKLVFVIMLFTNIKPSPLTNHIYICIYELTLIITFHSNFWIYCAMMHDFRKSLCKLVTCHVFKRRFKRLSSLSSAGSRTGSTRRQPVSRTSSITGRQRILSTTTSVQSTSSDNTHVTIPMSPIGTETARFESKMDDTCTNHIAHPEEDHEDVFM